MRVKKKRKHRKGRNYHHLRPRARKGNDSDKNVALLHILRHFEWHRVFGNRTLDECIALLTRLKRMKGYDYG